MIRNLIGILSLAGLIWVIYEVWFVNKRLGTGAKLLWTLFALFFGIIAAAVYYAVHKRR